MALYLLQSKKEPVQFYAREPGHIIELVEHYHEQAKQGGGLNDPRIASWVLKVPSLDDITQVNGGRINYHVGIVNLNPAEVDMDADLFSEKMQVTPDFVVAVSPESILYFEIHRRELAGLKRKELYKFHIPGGYFSSLTFVPQDIMEAITKYDLAPHIEKGLRARETIERKLAGCHNMAVEPIAAERRRRKNDSN